MNKKMSKRQRDIKSKLMAAISMLLVSSIMMISSTYAWFTLSTAPEVTGITTAVGANGNLEMALMPLSGETDDISSDVGDSINHQDKTLANVTWGNLVDLKNAYGLEGITLYPSALNVDETSGNINTTFPLQTPTYGVDGRVDDLVAKAQMGIYDGTGFKDKVVVELGGQATDQFMGVRGIGTVSGATQAQLDYKAALVNASSAALNAQNKASGALIEKGGALADIAIRHVNGDGAETYTSADVTNLQAMLNAVYGTESNPGSLLIIQNALKEYIVADYISNNSEGYETKVAEIRALTTLDPDAEYIPDGMVELITKLNTAITNAAAAQSALNAVTTYSWAEISAVVDKLAMTDKMNLNGFAIGALTEHVNDLMNDVLNGKGIVLYLQSGAGVFVDIADFCGDFAAPVVITKIEHSALPAPLENVKATMQTQTDVKTSYLTQAKGAIAAAPGGAGADASLPLSDFYGYIIDLAFRTNVAGSNLQLQTAAVDRIYSDSTSNEDTMGGGSTMIFQSADPNFTADRMIELMKHLKIVLFDPTDGAIIKNLMVTNVPTEIVTAADGTVTAPLYVAGDDGTPATRTNATTNEVEKDPTLVALDQNTIKQISVLVYLDGTTLTNADVANAVSSMAGSLNLQFSSSAELIPMEYADLKNGTVQAPESGTPTPDISNVTSSVTDGYTAVVKHVAVGETYKIVAVVTGTEGEVNADSGMTVTIGGTTATYQTVGTLSGWVVDGTETVPTETVAVAVTASGE